MISILYNDNNEILSIKNHDYNEEPIELIDLYNYYKFNNVIRFFKAILEIDLLNDKFYMIKNKKLKQNMMIYLNSIIDKNIYGQEILKIKKE